MFENRTDAVPFCIKSRGVAKSRMVLLASFTKVNRSVLDLMISHTADLCTQPSRLECSLHRYSLMLAIVLRATSALHCFDDCWTLLLGTLFRKHVRKKIPMARQECRSVGKAFCTTHRQPPMTMTLQITHTRMNVSSFLSSAISPLPFLADFSSRPQFASLPFPRVHADEPR